MNSAAAVVILTATSVAITCSATEMLDLGQDAGILSDITGRTITRVVITEGSCDRPRTPTDGR